MKQNTNSIVIFVDVLILHYKNREIFKASIMNNKVGCVGSNRGFFI